MTSTGQSSTTEHGSDRNTVIALTTVKTHKTTKPKISLAKYQIKRFLNKNAFRIKIIQLFIIVDAQNKFYVYYMY